VITPTTSVALPVTTRRLAAVREAVSARSEPTRPGRLRAIDATRGTAMFGVFISHFATIYFVPNGQLGLADIALTIGMIASPTFMLLSGVMLGFLYHNAGPDFARLRIKLIDRGLFLLTVGRALILLAHMPAAGVRQAFLFVFITDAIGVSLVVGPLLITAIGRRTRLALAIAMYAANWMATIAWHPVRAVPEGIKEVLFGSTDHGGHVFLYVFPIVAWLCVYLIGSSIGETLGALERGNRSGDVRLVLRRLSVGAAACIAVAFVVHRGLRLAHVFTAGEPLRAMLLNPSQKMPPGPIYLLIYAAAGLLILWALLEADRRDRLGWYLASAGLIGRASLMVFVAQYYVYFVVLYLLRLPFSPLWPLLLAASVVPLGSAAVLWDRGRYNRVLTVGLRSPRLADRVAAMPVNAS
jgi:heparan-alpha-glucosaminide N-acetyltransferase-like protein